MTLKPYRLRDKRKPRKKLSGDFISGGVNALLGVALLSATADAIKRI